ncbi:MAG: AzlD domain-containing protein [Chloroflexota bacterium]
MSLWFVIVGMSIVTLCVRLSCIALLDQYDFPDRVQTALRFVPVAVLSALIAPELLAINDVYTWSFDDGRLIAGMLAALVAWYTKNALLTVFSGMAVLFTIQYIFQ